MAYWLFKEEPTHYSFDDLLHAWSRRIASRLGLESSLRPRGRPRKED
jgi:hypothetical protein